VVSCFNFFERVHQNKAKKEIFHWKRKGDRLRSRWREYMSIKTSTWKSDHRIIIAAYLSTLYLSARAEEYRENWLTKKSVIHSYPPNPPILKEEENGQLVNCSGSMQDDEHVTMRESSAHRRKWGGVHTFERFTRMYDLLSPSCTINLARKRVWTVGWHCQKTGVSCLRVLIG